MTRPLVRLVLAACLLAAPLAAQEVAPFALPSSTTGAEAVLLNPAALADLEGAHGYLGLQQLYQKTDWRMVNGKSDSTIQVPFAATWNLSDDWAVGIGEMIAFDSASSFPLHGYYGESFRRFEFSVLEWRGAAAYRLSNAVNLGLAMRFLRADYDLAHMPDWPSSGNKPHLPVMEGSYSGSKDAWGLELSALWNAKGFTLGAILRPEVELDFGYADFGVSFGPITEVDPAEEAILHTYFPGGGVKSKAILPLEARVALTLDPMGPWRFSGELGWAQWSKWKTVSLDYANNTVEPDTGYPILFDSKIATDFQDAFTLTGIASRTFNNSIEAFARLAWQGKICKGAEYPDYPTLRPNDGAIITLGGRYPWKYGEFALAVDAFYTFGIYSSNNGFEMSRNLLGAGLSVAF